eukprot:5468-Heterococcus_DN1.PRE.2
MPISAAYTWTETADALQVCIPLKGSAPAKVDVFATDCVLKVSFPPYLVDIDLKGSIDETKSRANVKHGTLILRAPKAAGHSGLWGAIAVSSEEPREQVKERRQQSIADKQKRDDALAERARIRKHEDERKVLRTQMASESAERQQLEDLKAAEKERAEADVFATFERLNAQQQQAAAAAIAASAAAAVETRQTLAASSATSNATIWEDSEVDSDSDTDDDATADTRVDTCRGTSAAATAVDDATTATAADAADGAATGHSSAAELQEEEEVRYTPAPRHGATVALGFTAR